MVKIVVFSLLLTSGCASLSSENWTSRTLIQVKHARKYEPVGAKEYKHEDKNLLVTYAPDIVDAGLSFNFVNKTDKPIKILWDDSAFINAAGGSERVLHGGVRIIDRNQSQAPSIIIPKGTLSDDIISTEHVGTDPYLSSGWSYTPICGSKNIYTHDIKDEGCAGQTFGYFITYEVDGKKQSFTVKFKYVSKELLKKPEPKA